MELNKSDLKLIKAAKETLMNNLDLYKDKNTIVAAAISTKKGKIYSGINVLTSHSICAEQVAIGQAFACGERNFDTIVAIKLDNNNEARVVSPCGLCRYTMDKLGLDINVIVEDIKNDQILKLKASELLPYPYKRNDN